MTRSPDMEFVAVTMPNGVIVAHSSVTALARSCICRGREINAARIAQPAPTATPKWRIIRAWKAAGFFLSTVISCWETDPKVQGLPEPTIFLGLDVDPFEITNSQNRSYIAALGFVMPFVGMVCLVASFHLSRSGRRNPAGGNTGRKARCIAWKKKMRRSERMAAIGTLGGRVAHEIRNPLSSIRVMPPISDSAFFLGWAAIMIAEGCGERDGEARSAGSTGS